MKWLCISFTRVGVLLCLKYKRKSEKSRHLAKPGQDMDYKPRRKFQSKFIFRSCCRIIIRPTLMSCFVTFTFIRNRSTAIPCSIFASHYERYEYSNIKLFLLTCSMIDWLSKFGIDWLSKFGNDFDSRVTTVFCKLFNLASFLKRRG